MIQKYRVHNYVITNEKYIFYEIYYIHKISNIKVDPNALTLTNICKQLK